MNPHEQHKRSLYHADQAVGVLWLGLLLYVWAATEMLSLVRGITQWSLLAVWLIVLAGGVGCLLSQQGRAAMKTLFARGRRRVMQHIRSTRRFSFASICNLSTLVLASILFVQALAYPPNTWDSMTYHLPRVVQWLNQGSVDHYPVATIRQSYQPPLAEYVALYLLGITQSDRLLPLIQWSAYGVSILTVGSITRRLGGSRNARALARLLAATIPMAVLQATSTQNDVFLASLILIATDAAIALCSAHRPNGRSITHWLRLGLASGLALMTKGTAMLFLPWLFVVGVVGSLFAARKSKSRQLIYVAGAGMVALVIFTPHWLRNTQSFEHPLGPPAIVETYRNQPAGVLAVVTNASRDISRELATPLPALNRAMYDAVIHLHRAVGLTGQEEAYKFKHVQYGVPTIRINEDLMAGLWHAWLIPPALLALVWLVWRQKPGALPFALLAGVTSTSLFGFWFAVAWQPWHPRLHLPWMLLFCPALAWVLVQVRLMRVRFVIAAVLLATAFYVAIQNELRPIHWEGITQPRAQKYFNARPWMYEKHLAALEALPVDVERVGLVSSNDAWEFPWMMMTRQKLGRFIEFPQVGPGLFGTGHAPQAATVGGQIQDQSYADLPTWIFQSTDVGTDWLIGQGYRRVTPASTSSGEIEWPALWRRE